MKKTSIWRKLHRIWITAGATAGSVFVVWSLLAYRATAVARQAIESDAAVTVTRGDGSWSFTPRTPAAAGLIFFPGGLVDPVAYAPLTRAVAAAGYPSVLVEVPMRGAFGGADGPAVLGRALLAARSHGHVRAWVIAGHSRGGVIASTLARDGFPSLAGLVLIGTSHPRDFSLAALAVPVTRVYGTHDTIASVEKLERTRGNLPASTRMVRIDGGNHSQFGYYGFQPRAERRGSEPRRPLPRRRDRSRSNSVRSLSARSRRALPWCSAPLRCWPRSSLPYSSSAPTAATACCRPRRSTGLCTPTRDGDQASRPTRGRRTTTRRRARV